MSNLLPAILIGGPPHMGKSVLTYSITQALRKRHIDHYVIRACPDGEGDWSQEIDREAVRLIRIKGQWQPEFVRSVCYALESRQFPLLVDMGGRPEEWQMSIMQHCTHSLLLLNPADETSTQFWVQLVKDHNLLPLARLNSVLHGTSTLASQDATWLEGTLNGLERHTRAQGPVFDALVERIQTLFTSYSPEALRQEHFNTAPAEVVNLDTFLHHLAPESERWEPWMLQPLFAELPHQVPLAIYGRGTNWLYGALAEHIFPQPFYQFDPRLGWITPSQLTIGTSEEQPVSFEPRQDSAVTVLSTHLVNDYLDYAEADQLVCPALPVDQGVILNGKMPLWLVTALVHVYNTVVTVPWIACYSPQLERAVVVASRVTKHAIGDLIHHPLY